MICGEGRNLRGYKGGYKSIRHSFGQIRVVRPHAVAAEMTVALGGDDALVAEEFLDPSQRDTRDREPTCESMPQ